MINSLRKIDLLTTIVITILGLFQSQVTVFYIVYLFWFQELIRTVVDFVYLFLKKKTISEKFDFIKSTFGSFFLLFIYLVFIVVLFGFMLNWNNRKLLNNNVLVLMFHNWYFNINILLFLAEYIYFRVKIKDSALQLYIFNRRHIVLHISIILGAFIQLAIAPNFNINNILTSALVIVPFLLLKTLLDEATTTKVQIRKT